MIWPFADRVARWWSRLALPPRWRRRTRLLAPPGSSSSLPVRDYAFSGSGRSHLGAFRKSQQLPSFRRAEHGSPAEPATNTPLRRVFLSNTRCVWWFVGKGLGWYTGAEDGYMYVDQLRVEDIRKQVGSASAMFRCTFPAYFPKALLPGRKGRQAHAGRASTALYRTWLLQTRTAAQPHPLQQQPVPLPCLAYT